MSFDDERDQSGEPVSFEVELHAWFIIRFARVPGGCEFLQLQEPTQGDPDPPTQIERREFDLSQPPHRLYTTTQRNFEIFCRNTRIEGECFHASEPTSKMIQHVLDCMHRRDGKLEGQVPEGWWEQKKNR